MLELTSTEKTLLPLLDELDSKLGVLSQDKSDLETEISTAKNTLQTLLDTTVSEESTVQALLVDIERKLSLLAKAKSDLTVERDELITSSTSKDVSLEQKENQITALEGQISTIAGQLQKATEETETLNGQLTTLEQKEQLIVDLQGKIESLESERSQTSLEDFVKNANNELARARQALAEGGSKYALGRVALEVKMLPATNGVGMKFPSIEELKELGATPLSTLNVDFEAKEETEGRTPEIVVPTVLGYTEVLARRKLAAANLLVETSYQAVKEVPGHTLEADRVVNQIPKAAQKALPGSTVTIFIGRKS